MAMSTLDRRGALRAIKAQPRTAAGALAAFDVVANFCAEATVAVRAELATIANAIAALPAADDRLPANLLALSNVRGEAGILAVDANSALVYAKDLHLMATAIASSIPHREQTAETAGACNRSFNGPIRALRIAAANAAAESARLAMLTA